MDKIKPTEAWQDSPQRFQFGLKTIFVLVTLVAIWLGFYVFRMRQADAVFARAAAIYDTLANNLATLPEGTTLSVSTKQRRPQHGFRGAMRSRNTAVYTGRFVESCIDAIELDLAGPLAQMPKTDLDRILFEHYSKGLEEKGLERKPNPEGVFSALTGSRKNILPALTGPEKHVAAWYDPNHPNLIVNFQAVYNVYNNSQSTVSVIVKTEIDQPIFFGRKATAILGGLLIFITTTIITAVIQRSFRKPTSQNRS